MILVSDEQADQFFRRLLEEALEEQKVQLSLFVEFYVQGVLTRMVCLERDLRAPLADRFLRAQSRGIDEVQRVNLLQSVGDDALMLSGVFWQRVERVYRNPLDSAYHRRIGSLAYRQLSGRQLSGRQWSGEVFWELSERFNALADALMRIGDTCLLRTGEDIIRLVQLWQATRSRGAAQALARYGIAPTEQHSRTPS